MTTLLQVLEDTQIYTQFIFKSKEYMLEVLSNPI